jgi:hypothetical protein
MGRDCYSVQKSWQRPDASGRARFEVTQDTFIVTKFLRAIGSERA